jgi:hypothetical protein
MQEAIHLGVLSRMVRLARIALEENYCLLVVSLDRECFGEGCGEGEKVRAEALSIRGLEGSRWQGGRVWSYKLVWMQPK